ncbi:MAG: HAD family acid phosphatase [Bryobacteraceae bacterium]
MRLTGMVLMLCCWPAVGQQALVLVPGEPTNLTDIKKQLKNYHECNEANCYLPQLERQTDLAIGFLKQSVATAKATEKLAIVLDIDETSLSNWAVETLDDFGYIVADSNWCVSLRCGKAIAGTLRLFNEAEKENVAVFFITGRPEGQRADTEANLKAEGFDHWKHVYLRPDDCPNSKSVTEYKSCERGIIVAMGYRIVLNVGDQLSDLAGEPQAEHSVKLPNPFYCIP